MAEDRSPCRDEELPWRASSSECLSGDGYSEWLANRIAKGETVVVRPLPNSLATLRVRRWQSLTRRPESSAAETYLC
jgi:hypothetical protein